MITATKNVATQEPSTTPTDAELELDESGAL
jgi:hypothetical protein